MEEEVKSRKSSYVQCPSCGAVMRFDPKTNSLKCDYCDTTTALDESHLARRWDYNENTEIDFDSWGDVNHFRCATCGAVSVLPSYEMSPECPFCNSSNLIAEEEIKGLRPTGVLPFKIDKDDACLKYKDFIKKKWLAPSKLRKNFKVSTMKGIYIPIFSFTSDTDTNYSGVLGKYYYVTVGSGKNRHTERRIRYFNVSGAISRLFEDMQYEVSSNLEQKDLQKLGFYDVGNAVEYDRDYFAGFCSERYTESLDKTWNKAQVDMKKTIEHQIISQYNADVVRTLDMRTNYANRRYQYLLVPMWKCKYNYKKKFYDFFINARNGETTGKAPLSPLKVTGLVLLIMGVLVGLAFLFANYVY
jgi:DNA-directed RNA polymerase subunit RPC12/RpoP